jgi:hypothetical protein
VAKTKTTKRTAKAKQIAAGDMEVTVCRRRGERRQSAGASSTPPKAAGRASAKVAIEAKGARKSAKGAKGTNATPVVAEPSAKPVMERRKKVPRRRQIDPTTCERDYTGDEIEFMHALDAYKRSSGRMFPTCSEILEVVRGLGYVRLRDGREGATGGLAQDEADPAGRSEAEVGLTL